MTLFQGFQGVNNVVQIFPSEKGVFMRESNNNLYRVSTYFWAKVTSQIPHGIFLPSLFICILYFGTGLTLDPWWKPLVALGGAILLFNAFVAFGFVIGIAVPDK